MNLGKKLKKNGIAVDIINFGEEEANTPKLEAFIEQVNKDDNRFAHFFISEMVMWRRLINFTPQFLSPLFHVTSHLVTIPSGSATILTDAILSSAILGGEGWAAIDLREKKNNNNNNNNNNSNKKKNKNKRNS